MEAITKEMKPMFDKANPVRVTESKIASDLKELFLVPEYETITMKPKEESDDDDEENSDSCSDIF